MDYSSTPFLEGTLGVRSAAKALAPPRRECLD